MSSSDPCLENSLVLETEQAWPYWLGQNQLKPVSSGMVLCQVVFILLIFGSDH